MSRQSNIEDFFRSKASAISFQSQVKVESANDLPKKAKMIKVRENDKKASKPETSVDTVEVVDLCSSEESDNEITAVKPEECSVNLSQMSTTSADSQETLIYGTPDSVLEFKMEFEEEETIVLSPPMSPVTLEGSHTPARNISIGASSSNTVKTLYVTNEATSVSNTVNIQQMALNTVTSKSFEDSIFLSSSTSLNAADDKLAASASNDTIPKVLKDWELSTSSEQVSQITEKNQKTPQKYPEMKTPQAQPSTSKSSKTVKSSKTPLSSKSKSGESSKSQYFSPAKKRIITQRSSTNKVVRNLSQELEEKYLLECVKREQLVNGEDVDGGGSNNDTLYTLACQDMDDKTIFLLTTINDYLKNQSLSQLLDKDCQNLLLSCFSVVKPGMRLVCRLYWRKEGWYKRDPASVIAAGDKEPLDQQIFDEMVQDLITKGLIVEGDTSNVSIEDLASVLNKSDLMHICKDLKLKVQSKQEAVEALIKFTKRTVDMKNFLINKNCFCSNTELVLSKMKAQGGKMYKLSDKARSVLERLYMIMYLGLKKGVLREKTLEQILLLDKIQRETYPVDKNMTLDDASVVFKTRDEFESYKSAQDLYESFLAMTEVQQKCALVQRVFQLYQDLGESEMTRYASIPYWLRVYTPGGVYTKILHEGVSALKKDTEEGNILLALNILSTLRSQDMFLRHKTAEWYNEAALILDIKYHRCDEAAEVLLQGFNSNLSEEEKDTLRPRARKMSTQKNSSLGDNLRQDLLSHANKEDTLERNIGGQHIQKQPMERSKVRGKQKFQTITKEGRQIYEAEEYCIIHYISTGEFTHGEHWEGRIISTIFFLLFWDIIYQKPRNAPGIFLSYYQKYPLDLKSDSFYQNRKEMIDDWIDFIGKATNDKLISIMRDTWKRRPDHELSGIHRSIGWENIKMVTKCLGSRGLQAVCRRIAINYRHSSGFPDLTLWNVNNHKIKFVEVKTDFDKPSCQQIQWMSYLRVSAIETEFCYVGKDTMRQRSRQTANGQKRKALPKPSGSSSRASKKKPCRSSRLDDTLKKEPSDDDLAFEGS